MRLLFSQLLRETRRKTRDYIYHKPRYVWLPYRKKYICIIKTHNLPFAKRDGREFSKVFENNFRANGSSPLRVDVAYFIFFHHTPNDSDNITAPAS